MAPLISLTTPRHVLPSDRYVFKILQSLYGPEISWLWQNSHIHTVQALLIQIFSCLPIASLCNFAHSQFHSMQTWNQATIQQIKVLSGYFKLYIVTSILSSFETYSLPSCCFLCRLQSVRIMMSKTAGLRWSMRQWKSWWGDHFSLRSLKLCRSEI